MVVSDDSDADSNVVSERKLSQAGEGGSIVNDSPTDADPNEDANDDRNRRVDANAPQPQHHADEDETPSASDGCCSYYKRCTKSWPRTFAILFGVVMPLFLLIAVSLFFGHFLAQLEGPGEIETNNDIIKTKVAMATQMRVVDDITRKLPELCFCAGLGQIAHEAGKAVYEACLKEEQNSTCTKLPAVKDFFAIESFIQQSIERQMTSSCESNFSQSIAKVVNGEVLCRSTIQSLSPMNSTMSLEILEFLDRCGKTALVIVDQFQSYDFIDEDLTSSEVSFNWIRCDDDDNSMVDLANELFNPFFNTSRFHPENQVQRTTDAWRASQQGFYCQYLNETLKGNGNISFMDAHEVALEKSFVDADGFDSCTVNSAAGAWFWFTIMTTIGYGNTAPVTQGGRSMIFTLGFLSILIFAGVLAKAGSIIVAIVDDWLYRIKLSWLTWPSIQAFIWGALYYLWCYAIAWYYVYWNQERLDVEIMYKDAYWYAYITTTTVGLGDHYLDHAMLIGIDLLVWPLLILVGFVLLSSFLNKVGELLGNLMPAEKSSFVETLADDSRPMFSCCPNWFQKPQSSSGMESVSEGTVPLASQNLRQKKRWGS